MSDCSGPEFRVEIDENDNWLFTVTFHSASVFTVFKFRQVTFWPYTDFTAVLFVELEIFLHFIFKHFVFILLKYLQFSAHVQFLNLKIKHFLVLIIFFSPCGDWLDFKILDIFFLFLNLNFFLFDIFFKYFLFLCVNNERENIFFIIAWI